MLTMSDLVEDADDALSERTVSDKHVYTIFFLIVKLNLSTLWDNVVMNVLWLKNRTLGRLQFRYTITGTVLIDRTCM